MCFNVIHVTVSDWLGVLSIQSGQFYVTGTICTWYLTHFNMSIYNPLYVIHTICTVSDWLKFYQCNQDNFT